MGIVAPTNVVNLYLVSLEGDFNKENFEVTDSNQKTYTVSNTPEPGSVIVLLNGLYQVPGSGEAYTVSGSDITFTPSATLTVGDLIEIYYIIQV